jgi:RecA-family ATPase
MTNQEKQDAGLPRAFTAAELMKTEFQEPVWIVQGLLPEGLMLLVGKPKMGKSFLALNIAVQLAMGSKVLDNMPVEPTAVLYLALEDNFRRLRSRLWEMLFESQAPDNLHLFTNWKKADQGGLQDLETWLDGHPDVKLVILDTLERIRRQTNSLKRWYSEDYEAIQELKRIADSRSICVLAAHHLRKAHSDDPLEMISGSTGLTGAADTIAVLTRQRGQADAFLYITGRDIEETDLALSFDKDFVTWRVMGDAKDFKTTKSRYEILEHLRQAGVPQRPKQISEALGKNSNTVRVLLSRMVRDGQLAQPEDGYYVL